MADPNRDPSKKPDRTGDNVTTRVNVAFPFSSISVQQPSAELIELAGLVQELAELLVEVAPGAKAAELGDRARELLLRLK